MPSDRQLTTAELVWNRACSREAANLRDGDRALAAMLLVHGCIMNGGVSHAVLDMTPDELASGIRGYEFFGLNHLVSAIKEYQAAQDDAKANEVYYSAGMDAQIIEWFHRVFNEHPEYFAPMDNS